MEIKTKINQCEGCGKVIKDEESLWMHVFPKENESSSELCNSCFTKTDGEDYTEFPETEEEAFREQYDELYSPELVDSLWNFVKGRKRVKIFDECPDEDPESKNACTVVKIGVYYD